MKGDGCGRDTFAGGMEKEIGQDWDGEGTNEGLEFGPEL
eukprot:CAMPEP_0184684810 /NCGR_PEP_ID=MMETSP0312-20130426/16786_1 /TAXON_ID=31354 /ORGANISM="Compsopogon coeruleus, Strain SAG 36.94" /LENGTH=38 /DNA_ID= /DNA_START= /DNA_END= /DNA_ORIENTATION=